MTINVTSIGSKMDPRIREILSIEPYTAVLITIPVSADGQEMIRDVVLRTGRTGWQRCGAHDRQYLTGNEIENYLSDLLRSQPRVQFHKVTVSA